MKKRKVALFTYLILGIILCLLFAKRFLPFDSYGADDTKVMIESKLNKYINYDLSEDDKGTLVQYEIRTKIEYGEEVIPVSQKETFVNFSQIDGKYPIEVKMLTTDASVEEESQYDATTGTLRIQANNQNENGDYIVIAYYPSFTEENPERELETTVVAEVTLADEGNRKISSREQYKDIVTENIGELTSIDSKAEEIYNGYLKANRINGTDYATEYRQQEQIVISKKEAQETIEILENNTFIKEDTDIGNNHNLIYKSTQISKAEIEKLLGTEGTVEILDSEENTIITIDQNTEFDEEGILTIVYENEPEGIKIRTSHVETEGILNLKHTKEIKSTMTDFQKVSAKTTIELQGVEKNYEIVNELKEAQTTVKVDTNNTNWSNEHQNEINFDIYLDASSSQNNMFKNPTLRIELPSQVEKVVLGESSLVYANGLELQTPYVEMNENGNNVIVANLVGEQKQYDNNSLGLMTNVKIAATVILKKDIESATENIKLVYTNQYTLDGTIEVGNQEISVQLENYREENNEKIEQPLIYSIAQPSAQNVDAIKLEVAPTKGNTTLQNEDIIYEGEYIKYNLKLSNESDEDIENVKVVATIPEGVTYGELKTNYYDYRQEYLYYFQKELKEKTIDIGTIKAGETINTFYEVKVNDLAEGEETKTIVTNIKTYVGEQSIQNYEITNTVEYSEVKLFLGSKIDYGNWKYNLDLTSKKEEVTVKLHFPQAFEMKDIIYGSEMVYLKEANIENLKIEISEDNVLTAQLKPGNYSFGGSFNASKIERTGNELIVELRAYAETILEDKHYISNENRVEYACQNVEVSMSSSNEGQKVQYGEKIDYEIRIENTGRSNVIAEKFVDFVTVELSDFLPEELKPISVTYDKWELNQIDSGKYEINKMEPVTKEITRYADEDKNTIPNVNISITIPRGETAVIKIETTAGYVFKETNIKNSVTVSGDLIRTKTSNIVEHTILAEAYDDQEEPDDSEEPDDLENPDDSENPDDPNSKNYRISGIAWIDENEDGERNSDETFLEGITVMLIDIADSNTIKSTTETNKSGRYEFSNLEQSNYLVAFKYDTSKYKLSEYQKSGISSDKNSDVLNKTIMLSGKQEQVGITDKIELNKSATNIDIGLIEKKLYDFKIEKYIDKVIVQTAKQTKQYTYDNQNLAKIEIKAKEIEGANIIVEYKIIVTNVGEAEGTISKISDYLPEGLSFLDTQNNGWAKKTNNELVYTNTVNNKIEVGESIELTLLTTKKMTANATGTFTNRVSIIEESDVNSNNNTASADIIISVSTGAIVYITITILIVMILSIIAIYLYKRGKINIKKVNKTMIIMLFMLTMIISLTTNVFAESYTYVLPVPSHRFTGGISGGGACMDGDLPAAGSWEFDYERAEPRDYSYLYNTSYNETAWSETNRTGTYTLTKNNNTISMKKWDDDYYIYGPFKFNCSANLKYNINIHDTNGTSIRNFEILDEDKNEIAELEGSGDITFYLKIAKSKCSDGIGKVQLSTTKNIMIYETRTITEQAAYFYNENFQRVNSDPWSRPESREREVPYPQDIEWTDINGCLKIIKQDKDNHDVKLPNVVVNVKCSDTRYNEDHTTNADGEIFIQNLKRGIYTVTEKSNPNYGYTVMVSKNKSIKKGSEVILELNNTKQTGNLQIDKIDKDTKEPLEGVSFKIQSTTKGYVQAYTGNPPTYQAKLTGENRLTNLTYTTDINQATEFVTDSNGLVGVYNILIDTYNVYEISVGTNSQYEIDDNYIDWSYVSSKTENNKNGTGHIATVTIARRKSTNTDDVTTIHDTLTVENRKKYINLCGFVWEDLEYVEKNEGEDSKTILKNRIYDGDNPNNPDKLVKDIKVTLKDSTGNPVVLKNDTYGNPQQNPKVTNAKGEYRFELIEIDKLKTYYMEFEYNGMSYINVIPQTKDSAGVEIPNASKASEGEERTNFNKNYETITSGGANKNVDGNLQHTYNINYDTTTPGESKLIYKVDGNGKEDKSNYNYGYEGNENADPFGGVDLQYYINANTKNAYNGGYLNSIVSENDIRTKGIREIDNINLGLQKREQVDLTLIKDINSVKVSINRVEYTYKYAERFNSDLWVKYNDEGKSGYDMTPQVKFGNKYGSMSYTRALYPSDIRYPGDEKGEGKLKVEVTYKIGIQNNLSDDIITTVNELTDYYDNKYQVLKVGKDINEDGTVKDEITGTTGQQVEGYTKVTIPANLKVEGENYIYVQLEVKPSEIVKLLGDAEDDRLVEMNNMIEITSYSSKYKDGNIYASIDKDSQPGNLNINDSTTYEDDTDKAPGLKLTLQEEREVSGIVFVDETGELQTEKERQGDGAYTAGEAGVNGVRVRLVKADGTGTTAKKYDQDKTEGESWADAITETNTDGTYSIKGFIPDNYYIEYTWGGQTYLKNGEEQLIRVQEYKSTVVDKNAHNAKSENSNPEWYKDEFKQQYPNVEWENNKERRVSDALDNYETRKDIDAQTTIMTNGNKKVIENYQGELVETEGGIAKELITTMTSTTPNFKVNVEYYADMSSSEEYEVDQETGEVKMNGNYVVKKDGYKNHLKSIDFGIVERAKQVLKLEKEVNHIKITLANGNTLIDSNVTTDVDGNRKLEDGTKHAVYIPESLTNAQIKCEIDNELIQGSNLEINYGLKITNISELDYNNDDYYYYGIGYGDNDSDLIQLDAKKVIDYLDNNLTTINSENENLGDIRYTQDEKISLMNDKLLEDTEDMKTLLDNTNRVMIIDGLSKQLQPKGTDKTTEVTLIANKELTNTAVQEGILLDNDAEIIRIEKTGGAPIITMPGNYIPSNLDTREVDSDKAESVTVVPPTGLTTNYIAYTILAISSLGVTIGGIILIKKFVLK